MKSSHAYRRFRATLRQIRQEAGLSQGDLAEMLGRPQTFVSKSELGERRVDFLEALEICAACGVSVHQFTQRVSKDAPRTQPAVQPKLVRPRKQATRARPSCR